MAAVDDERLAIDDQRIVSFHYNLNNGAGDLIDSSQGNIPLVYMHNSGTLLGALERELTGHVAGDSLDVVIFPEDAYGYADPDRVQVLDRQLFSDIDGLAVGMRVRARSRDGDAAEMLTVREIREDDVVVDGNHPLAGQVLHFQLVIVDVREPTDTEREQGFATVSSSLPAGSQEAFR